MKVIFIYILVLLIYGTNCISQSRIKTVDDNYVCFIINENDTHIIIQTFKNRKEILKKSIIMKREDIIVFLETNTSKVTGNIQKLQDDEFEMMTSDSVLVKIKINTIEDGRSEDAAVVQLLNELIKTKKTVAIQATDTLSQRYSKFGFTVGSPLKVMMNYGINNNRTSAGISLGYLGVQFNFGLNVISNEDIEINFLVNLNLGRYISDTSDMDRQIERYKFGFLYGPLIDFYAAGFHVQAGAGYRTGKDVQKEPFFQIGYAYRWRK